MKFLKLALLTFCLSLSWTALSQEPELPNSVTVQLRWTQPTTTASGAPLTNPLTGNEVYYNSISAEGPWTKWASVPNPNWKGYKITINRDVRYWFAVTAVNTDGESALSNVLTKRIGISFPTPDPIPEPEPVIDLPGAPSNLIVLEILCPVDFVCEAKIIQP